MSGMKLNKLAILYLIAGAVFILPFLAVAKDTVSGRPFQALQEQIDALQEQIDALQTGPVKAYVTKNGAENLTDLNPLVDYDVMTLSLPKGKYIYTITIQASYYPNGIYDPNSQTFLDCWFLYSNDQPGLGHHIGGGVNGTDMLALTTEEEIYEDETEVTLVCNHDPFDSGETVTINSTVWTTIKVGELVRQNIE
jgi:hypothetical protein